MTDAMTETTRTAPPTGEAADAFAQMERYTRFWNTGPDDERARLASAVFTDEVEYRAPVGFLRGAAALADFRDQFVSHAGPATVRRREEPEVHHGRARLRWEILTGDGTSFATGTDVIEFDEDGRIRAISAFLDRAPAGFDPTAHD
ncbi:nuclear transport factor 2 family protein [Streptomyces albogriseolus]|uniref:nuclear transport factor 2 family protein n=1 Tax=Streptomyces albogriseolus TaxID=1887 RepID=UPI0033BD7F2E